MKYMLLIHQVDAPTPRDPEAWARLPEEEQNAVYADYKGINETPGVSPASSSSRPTRRPRSGSRTAGRSPPMVRSSR